MYIQVFAAVFTPPPLSFRKKATKHKKQRNKNFQNKKKTSKKEKTKTKKRRRKFQVKTIHSSSYVNSNEDSPFTRSMNAA